MLLNDLAFSHNEPFKSHLDVLLKNKANSLINVMLQLMARQDVTGLLYQELDKYLAEFVDQRIDLKGVMQSAIARLRACDDWMGQDMSHEKDKVMYAINQGSVGEIRDNFKNTLSSF
jgi:hypothetical protein